MIATDVMGDMGTIFVVSSSIHTTYVFANHDVLRSNLVINASLDVKRNLAGAGVDVDEAQSRRMTVLRVRLYYEYESFTPT